jgi:PleD family two-component response regulator
VAPGSRWILIDVDGALYRAKAEGRNRVAIASDTAAPAA